MATTPRTYSASDPISVVHPQGGTVTLPLPTGFGSPTATWDWARPFSPRGDVGGVRTSDLEWAFVDKGDWPVVTFFTLAYAVERAVTEVE